MTRRDLFIRLEARSDLFEIYEYLAARAGHEFGIRYVERIEKACEGLTEFPAKGKPRSDLGDDLRSLNFEGRAVVVYIIEDRTIEIVRIFHAGRDFGPETFEN